MHVGPLLSTLGMPRYSLNALASIVAIMSGTKRKCFSQADKLEIVQYHLSSKGTQRQTAEHFGINPQTLNNILKAKDVILQAASDGVLKTNVKLCRPTTMEDVDTALLEWFRQNRAAHPTCTIDGDMLLKAANDLSAGMGCGEVSMSWINRFKKRHDIVHRKLHGESGAVAIGDVQDWNTTTLPLILAEFEPKDVFNCDDTGLFWRATPDSTLAFRGEKCSGGKQSKERLTLLLGASMAGEKLPPLAIGHAQRPRCFKNVRHLPLEYHANKSAWMTGNLFVSWLHKLNAKMRAENNRKIAMILDNCPSHPHEVENLSNIKLFFLPPNTTSKTQPLDAGVIRNFKLHYRRELCRKKLASLSAAMPFTFTVLDALRVAKFAWDKVTAETVANCFRHCGFVVGAEEDVVAVTDDIVDDTDIDSFVHLSNPHSSISVDEYIAIDDDLATSAIQSITEIASNTLNNVVVISDESEGEEDDSFQIEKTAAPPTISETLKLLQQLQASLNYHVNDANDAQKCNDALNLISRQFENQSISNRRQLSIDQFLRPVN